MRRHLLFIILFFIAVNSYSQKSFRFTSAISANDYTMYGYGTQLGYRFGPGIEFRKDDSWISYGFDLLLTTKGTSGDEGSMVQKYIQVPANLNFHLPMSDSFELVWANSFYLAYGFGGKSKYMENGYEWVTTTFSDDNAWGKKIPRFDMGLSSGVAFDFGRCALGLSFEMGLFPLDSETYYNEYDEEEVEAALNISMFLSFTVRF